MIDDERLIKYSLQEILVLSYLEFGSLLLSFMANSQHESTNF